MIKILIHRSSFSRNNGGASTLADLSSVLENLGYNVRYALPPSYFMNILFLKDIINGRYKINTLCMHYTGSSRIINLILNYIFCASYFYRKRVRESDLIIVGASLNKSQISFIKNKSNAKIILNHAGSADAFIEYYWISESFRTNKSESTYDDYVNYINYFDGCIIQSINHQPNLSSIDKSKYFLIRPSTQESEVIKATFKSKEVGFDKNTFNLVCVGSVQQRKGQDLALEVLNCLINKNNIILHFVGKYSVSDAYYKSLHETIKKYGIKNRVKFHGFKENYLEFMAASDIIFQPSRAEGVSRILREAMYMRKPIVAFSLSGTKDLITNGKSGLLADKFNLDEIAEMINLLYENENKRENLTHEAFKLYLLNNSFSSYISSVASMINYFTNQNHSVNRQ